MVILAIDELRATGFFTEMDLDTDEDEHSIEMHLPYVRKIFEGYRSILFASLQPSENVVQDGYSNCSHSRWRDKQGERRVFRQSSCSFPPPRGHLLCCVQRLLPLVRTSYSIIHLSDCIHRGTRFSYTFYYPEPPSGNESTHGIHLSRSNGPARDFSIHESISALDHQAMDILTLPPTTGSQAHGEFASYLSRTKNTICGRHPIGVLLGALGELEQKDVSATIRWVRYEQSSQCKGIGDSSVSYASAYVVF